MNLLNLPTCDEQDCNGVVEMIWHVCNCGSIEYVAKFKTIQVKSSRIEFDEKSGKSKNTYAIDIKPRDLIEENHFFIWCLLDNEDRPNFLVMSVQDFKNIMGESIKGISFFKDQDRQHFSAKDFGKWKKFLNNFSILE
ncbi:MAG: hypothetical protein FJW61_05585 [Actinobacteria bacterium]|nr:hypothetical protein [Actinomycetota bacterium]